MHIEENVDLLPHNSFHFSVQARYWASVQSTEDLKEVLTSGIYRAWPSLILGGGSNILLTGNFPGLVLKNEITGIYEISQTDRHVELKVGSGEPWHPFVLHCVARDFGGVENLSLIPGTVGAAPMQNIGAYGTEIKDCLVSVEAIDRATGAAVVFSNEDCRFGYRESIFKNEVKDRYFITYVTFRLTKGNHRLNIQYGALKQALGAVNADELTLKAISDAVIEVRRQKLPDPQLIGNAGSFFKNPSVTNDDLTRLRERYPLMPTFPGEHGLIKIPAAWLIEQCGWKGKTFGPVGVHKHQALVLVHYGGGSGDALWRLAMDIQASVKEKFNIVLQPEVNKIDA